MQIEVLDRIMGSGKTKSILEWLSCNQKFIFVTPLLSEAEDRINEARPDLLIKSPVQKSTKVGDDYSYTKTEGFLDLLQNGSNIATTHSLLKLCDSRHLELIKNQDYILIIDEDVSLIESFSDLPVADMRWLFENGHLTRDDVNGRLHFNDKTYIQKFRYEKVKDLCQKGLLYSAKRSNNFIVTCLPVETIMCAKRVVLLTYMFKGSVLDQFLQMNGVSVVPFTDVDVPNIKPSAYKHLIQMIDDKHNKQYEKIKLTQSAWDEKDSKDVSVVEKTLRNIFNGVDADYCAFAVPKKFVVRQEGTRNKLVKPNGKVHREDRPTWLYPKCRATNDYSHKNVMVYCIDVHPHVAVSAYLQDEGYTVDKDMYAISQLVQWLWRGCIRNGEVMTVGVLPKRMRELFVRWLNDEFI